MKQSERASIMRIVTDLIEADGIIDTREIRFLETLRSKYSIKKDDEKLASTYALSKAMSVLSEAPESLKNDLLGDFVNVAMSDDYCAREEALLILAIRCCLSEDASAQAMVLSFDTSNLNFEDSHIIYVESEYDADANKQIHDHFREIRTEIRLAGFDLVYLPQMSEHYKSISAKDLQYMSEFLYPRASEVRLSLITEQLCDLSTARFCKDQLSAKLGVKDMASVPPSFMLKIGSSFVNDKPVCNFLVIETADDVLATVRYLLDQFTSIYRNYRVNYLKEEKGRFVFKGFYKQIFDLLVLRKGIRSRVVIDCARGQIYFPDADVKIEKIHRREKALYALILLETASGGINFSKPASARGLERYEKRMAAIQNKYKMIYRMFGGDESKAPNLEIAENRLPMISLLKKQLLALGDILYHVDDYTIQRNIFGNYCVNIPASQCYCTDDDNTGLTLLCESVHWQRISAL